MNLQFGDFTAIFDFKGDLFIVRFRTAQDRERNFILKAGEKTAEGCSVWMATV